MKVTIIFGVFIFAFLWASASSAAIYTWTDENGVMHFTNVAPPAHARVIVKDIPKKHNSAAEKARRDSVEKRLKRAEERADELERSLDNAREKAEALERRLANANRMAEEAPGVQQASYGYDETWEEEYSRYPYYGGYVYRAVPLGRSICRPRYWRHPRYGPWKKGHRGKHHWRHRPWKGKHHYGHRPWGGSRHYGVVGINRARTQSHHIFNKSRSNPFRSNFVSRRAIY